MVQKSNTSNAVFYNTKIWNFPAAGYEVFRTVKIQIEFFWAMTPCSVFVGYQHFRIPCWHYTASRTRRTPLKTPRIFLRYPYFKKLSGCGPTYKVTSYATTKKSFSIWTGKNSKKIKTQPIRQVDRTTYKTNKRSFVRRL